jgi:hypothetical protein
MNKERSLFTFAKHFVLPMQNDHTIACFSASAATQVSGKQCGRIFGVPLTNTSRHADPDKNLLAFLLSFSREANGGARARPSALYRTPHTISHNISPLRRKLSRFLREIARTEGRSRCFSFLFPFVVVFSFVFFFCRPLTRFPPLARGIFGIFCFNRLSQREF